MLMATQADRIHQTILNLLPLGRSFGKVQRPEPKQKQWSDYPQQVKQATNQLNHQTKVYQIQKEDIFLLLTNNLLNMLN